ALPASEMRRAVAEVEARPYQGAGRGAAVVELVPARITREVLGRAVCPPIPQPNPPARIPGLHHLEQPQAVEGGAVGPVPVAHVADRRDVVYRRRDDALSLVALRVIAQRPAVDGAPGREPLEPCPAGLRVALGREGAG